MITLSKSSILSYAWVIARYAAAQTGEPVRSKIGDAMRRAWAEAKAAATAVVVPQTVQQQACTASDLTDFDQSYECSDFVCGSADQARIILAGIDAARVGEDPRAAEIAAAAMTRPAGMPTNAWLDEEVRSYADDVLRELCEPIKTDQVCPMPDLADAAFAAFRATKAWVGIFEQWRDSPMTIEFGEIFAARQAMQNAHARLDALNAGAR